MDDQNEKPDSEQPKRSRPSSSEGSCSSVTPSHRGPIEATVALHNLKHLAQCNIKLGNLSFSSTHTVFVNVDMYNCDKTLLVQEGAYIWHSDFVKMPCSDSSYINNTGNKRWNVIKKQLDKLSKKNKATVNNVKEAILKYNPKYEGQWSFDALEHFVKFHQCNPKTGNYYENLFPKIAALALMLPCFVRKAIPLLQRGHTSSITLSQVQIACLLANAFFCTFPHRNTMSRYSEYGNYPSINFSSLFGEGSQRKNEKLKAILHYFYVVTNDDTKPKGLVTFERRCLRSTDIPDWKRCDKLMPKLHVTSQGSIETEGVGMLQIDFASKWVGGGVLNNGLVQEEILFLINPELIVARLFTEKLEDNECLLITGSQQFSRYSGFSDHFKWVGPNEDLDLKRDEWSRLQRQIVAIDATHFRNREEQYNMTRVERDLNKAYCGFKGHGHDEPDIATGNWGCGAFNGDPQLKALIQLMAVAEAQRGMAMFTFKDERLEKGLQQMFCLLVKRKISVGNLYRHLKDYCDYRRTFNASQVDLFEFLTNKLRSPQSHL